MAKYMAFNSWSEIRSMVHSLERFIGISLTNFCTNPWENSFTIPQDIPGQQAMQRICNIYGCSSHVALLLSRLHLLRFIHHGPYLWVQLTTIIRAELNLLDTFEFGVM